jgi:hypothetical protein
MTNDTRTETLGQVIDELGITVTLEDGDLISDVVVLSEVLKADGTKSLVISEANFANWLKTEGMISKAYKVIG